MSLKHFLTIARAGRNRGASSGEKDARQLAIAIREYALGLDDEAIEGAALFMQYCRQFPSTAREFTEGLKTRASQLTN